MIVIIATVAPIVNPPRGNFSTLGLGPSDGRCAISGGLFGVATALYLS